MSHPAAGPPPVVLLSALEPLGTVLSKDNGQSRRVCLVPSLPGWLYKEYLAPLSGTDVQRLDRLIALPAAMRPADRAVATAHTSWPGGRVTTGSKSVGVLIPRAPASCWAELQLSAGKTVSKLLEIDILAQPATYQAKLGLPAQSLSDRLKVCATVAQAGALLERHGVVYLDWSYRNLLWSAPGRSAYVIDMDGCSFGPRAQIVSPNWDDPLVPGKQQAGRETDRYRVALLIGRCLTSERGSPAETRTALNDLRARNSAEIERVVELLIGTIAAARPGDRQPLSALSAALDAATATATRAGTLSRPSGGGTVVGIKRVGPGTKNPGAPPPATSAPPPSGPRPTTSWPTTSQPTRSQPTRSRPTIPPSRPVTTNPAPVTTPFLTSLGTASSRAAAVTGAYVPPATVGTGASRPGSVARKPSSQSSSAPWGWIGSVALLIVAVVVITVIALSL